MACDARSVAVDNIVVDWLGNVVVRDTMICVAVGFLHTLCCEDQRIT